MKVVPCRCSCQVEEEKMTIGEKIEETEKLGVVYFESSVGGFGHRRRCTVTEYYSTRVAAFSQYRPVFKTEIE